MKKQFFMAMAAFLLIGLTNQLFAQDPSALRNGKSKSNLSNNVVDTAPNETCMVKVTNTGSACEIVISNQIKGPRDAASGMATGKRMHKPFVITKELDKIAPTTGGLPAAKQGGGKASFSDLSVMISIGGRSQKLTGVNGEFTLPKCPNGDCSMVVSWSWGATNSGTSKRCEVPVQLTIEDGACIAIKENGVKTAL